MRIETVTKLGCDFCAKSQDDVEVLIRGPRDICICDECVVVARKVIDEQREKQASFPLIEEPKAA